MNTDEKLKPEAILPGTPCLANGETTTEDRADSAPDQIDYPEQELTGKILSCAFAVHNTLGAGFLERVYANSLAIELRREGLGCVQEASLKVRYRDAIVGDYVADMIVADRVLLELKACAALDGNHSAQIMNYLRASRLRVGLLLNFGRPKLEYRRFVV